MNEQQNAMDTGVKEIKADVKTITKKSIKRWNVIVDVVVGNRNVFTSDLKDIFDYFGKVCITSNELMTLFFNQITQVSKYLWLRSSHASNSNGAWLVSGGYGALAALM